MIEYRTFYIDDVIRTKMVSWEMVGHLQGESCWCLYKFVDDRPVSLVFCDAMEPEDRFLVRDLSPLVDELNALAKSFEPQSSSEED